MLCSAKVSVEADDAGAGFLYLPPFQVLGPSLLAGISAGCLLWHFMFKTISIWTGSRRESYLEPTLEGRSAQGWPQTAAEYDIWK